MYLQSTGSFRSSRPTENASQGQGKYFRIMNCPSCSCPDTKCGRCARASVTPVVCFLLIASVSLVIVLAEVLVKEHVHARDFIDSKCRVVEHRDLNTQTCSKCIHSGGYGYSHSDCYESTFPCVQVRVQITEKNGTLEFGTVHTAASQLKEYPEVTIHFRFAEPLCRALLQYTS